MELSRILGVHFPSPTEPLLKYLGEEIQVEVKETKEEQEITEESILESAETKTRDLKEAVDGRLLGDEKQQGIRRVLSNSFL